MKQLKILCQGPKIGNSLFFSIKCDGIVSTCLVQKIPEVNKVICTYSQHIELPIHST